jgi:hypothetical protein
MQYESARQGRSPVLAQDRVFRDIRTHWVISLWTLRFRGKSRDIQLPVTRPPMHNPDSFQPK